MMSSAGGAAGKAGQGLGPMLVVALARWMLALTLLWHRVSLLPTAWLATAFVPAGLQAAAATGERRKQPILSRSVVAASHSASEHCRQHKKQESDTATLCTVACGMAVVLV